MISAGLLFPFGAPANAPGEAPPDTPAGTAVDASGCPVQPSSGPIDGQSDLSGAVVGDSFVPEGVNFDFDKAELRPEAKDILDGVTQKLIQTAPEVKVEVGGHTDELGSAEYNQQLSERRAKAVSSYLQASGVADERLTERGYCESAPLVPNDSDEARAKNRRVELKVMESAY